MTERTLAALVAPWRRFPHTLMFYSATGVFGAAMLAALHVWFPPQHISLPKSETVVPLPEPSPTAPTYIPAEPKNISTLMDSLAWNSALNADNLDGYRAYILQHPTSRHASDAMKQIDRILSDDEQLRNAEAQLADTDTSLPLIAQLIEDQNNNPTSLLKFTKKFALSYKYPFGFALFYSNGTQVLSYYTTDNGPIRFDPTVSHFFFSKPQTGGGLTVCYDYLPIRINGRRFDNINHNCFGNYGSVMGLARLDYAALVVEYLASSPHGVAWIVGMKP